MLQHKLHTRAKLSSATFGYVAESAFGPWAVRAVDGCILVSLLGCVVLYLISLATIWYRTNRDKNFGLRRMLEKK